MPLIRKGLRSKIGFDKGRDARKTVARTDFLPFLKVARGVPDGYFNDATSAFQELGGELHLLFKNTPR